jgi:hypothetical protein
MIVALALSQQAMLITKNAGHSLTDAVGLSFPVVLLQASLNALNVQSATGKSSQNASP